MNKKLVLASATSKDVSISPTKINAVASKIRGKRYRDALIVFETINQKAGAVVLQTLISAGANAMNDSKVQKDEQLTKDELVIVEAFANQGKIFKRMQPRARGKAYEIQKKTSHITIRLSSINSN